jgi:hypothetical protein
MKFQEWKQREMAALTWKCDICGMERPDAQISVHKVDMHPEAPGIVIRNVKFCNDNLACQEGAQRWKAS